MRSRAYGSLAVNQVRLHEVRDAGWHALRYSEGRAELPQILVPCDW